MHRLLVLLLACSTVSVCQTTAPETGSVQGVVLDEKGDPLADATVFVGTMTKGPSTQTDQKGRFTLTGVPSGTVGLHAYKKSAGYPYDLFAFFVAPSAKLPFIEVIAGETTAGVTIQLGERAAHLSIKITDQNENEVDATVELTRPDLGKYGEYRTSAKGGLDLMVPPVPFRMRVKAQGFCAWQYGSSKWSPDSGLISIRSGESLDVPVQLKKPNPGCGD